jgi:hypothetical protein
LHVLCFVTHVCQDYIWYFFIWRCKHSILIVQWVIIVVVICHDYIGHNNSLWVLQLFLQCHMLVYYLIVWTYGCNVHLLVACIMFYCIHVSKFCLIFFHLEMLTTFFVMQWGLIIIIITYLDYIEHNRSLGIVTFLVMSIMC